MDVENLQMLQCISCRTKQVSVHDLCQRSTLRKIFIKYNKFNEIVPMKNHIEFTHPRLVANRKLAINVEKIKRIVGGQKHTIVTSFGALLGLVL
jgi:hypothetical protein